tara:strand:- start:11 stop:277 length:267 start_codon:yes stop_codon:yes gene_type:complete
MKSVQFQIGTAYASEAGTYVVLSKTEKTITLKDTRGWVHRKALRTLRVDGAEFFYTTTGPYRVFVRAHDVMDIDIFNSLTTKHDENYV